MEATIVGLLLLVISGVFLTLLKSLPTNIPHADSLYLRSVTITYLSVKEGMSDIWCFVIKSIPYTNPTSENSVSGIQTSYKESALFSILLAYFGGMITKLLPTPQPNQKVRKSKGTELDVMLGKAQSAGHPIMVTLKNRKVYVGAIEELPPLLGNNKNERKYIKMSILRSGFRNLRTLKIENMTDYGNLLLKARVIDRLSTKKNKQAEDITVNNTVVPYRKMAEAYKSGVLIDADEILSVRLWDKQVYTTYKNFESTPTNQANQVQDESGAKQGKETNRAKANKGNSVKKGSKKAKKESKKRVAKKSPEKGSE